MKYTIDIWNFNDLIYQDSLYEVSNIRLQRFKKILVWGEID